MWLLQSCRALLPMASPWLLSDCAGSGCPIHIGPCLSNQPVWLDPCDMVGCQGRVAHHYWAMMTNITAPLWTRPGQVVVTLLCFQSWVGETEIKDNMWIHAGWHQGSTCLGMGNDDWKGVAAHYCLGQHIPHPDCGNTGQSPAVGPRELNPLSVHFWVIQKMCLS